MDIFAIKTNKSNKLKIESVDVENYEDTYDMLKSQINGTIAVTAVGELDIWIDDEGLLKQLSPTILIKRSKGNSITNKDTLLVGPVVLASRDEEGETIGLTESAKDVVSNMQPALLGEWPVFVIEQY